MKLLLVNPFFKGAIPIPSFGLGFIATYVRDKAGCEVEVIEQAMSGVTEAELLEKVKGSDFLGLVCYTESRMEVFDFARKAKEANPSIKIMVGGAHAQTLDGLILNHYPFMDFVVRGEGEETVLELVQGKPLNEIAGITWRDGTEIKRNPDRTFMQDIDGLYLDYSLIAEQIEGWKDFEVPVSIQKMKSLPAIASRGCPFKCKFCASNRQWGTTYRYLTPEELVRRIEYFVKEHGIRYFRFYDALFIGSEPRLTKFCDLLEEKNLKISFRVDVRVGTRESVLRRLRKAGCDVLGFGIESGSDRILKRMNKGITRKQIEETIALCRDLGYWIIGFFMISLPDETEEDIKKTFELLKYFDEADVQFFKIHPNTAFYDELRERGEINDEIWFDHSQDRELFYSTERFKSANFTADEINSHLSYAYNYIRLRNPKKTIGVHGLLKGTALLLAAGAANAMISNNTGRKLHRKIKNLGLMRSLYGWIGKT